MIKKSVGLLIILFIIISSSFVFGVDTSAVDSLNEKIISASGDIEKTREEIENTRWEYISARWQEILLKNKYVSAVDSFLKGINVIFVIFLGQSYNFTFNFFVPLILWFIFLYFYYHIFRNFSSFSKRISFLAGLGVTIITGQIGILRLTSEGIFRIIFYKSGWWSWIATFIVAFFIALAIGGLGLLGKRNRARKKAFDEMIAESDRRVLHAYADTLRKDWGHG